RKKTQEEISREVKELYDGEYELISDYTKMTDPIKVKHLPCNKEYTIKRAKGFINEGTNKCPICYPRKLGGNSTKRITEEEFLKRFKNKLSDEYTYISGFKNTKENILIRHNVCGHEYKVSPNMLLGSRNRRCPNCANNKRGSKADKNYLD